MQNYYDDLTQGNLDFLYKREMSGTASLMPATSTPTTPPSAGCSTATLRTTSRSLLLWHCCLLGALGQAARRRRWSLLAACPCNPSRRLPIPRKPELSGLAPCFRFLVPASCRIGASALPKGLRYLQLPPTDSPLAERVLACMMEAVIRFDLAGSTIALWNPAAETMFGFSAAEAIGQSLDIIIPERLREAHWRSFHAAIASGRTRLNGRRPSPCPAQIRRDALRRINCHGLHGQRRSSALWSRWPAMQQTYTFSAKAAQALGRDSCAMFKT